MATADQHTAYADADYIIIATPTDFDPKTNRFDTRSIESVLAAAAPINKHCTFVIKSTVPMGYTERIQQMYPHHSILFSPEFLREGSALYDCLHPSRIIMGGSQGHCEEFAHLLSQSAQKEKVEILYMSTTEAEAVKLFSNSYLAMRVAFFNELDTYSEVHQLDTRKIIEGICLDPRIGSGYNNPSFGYGGYCLPKDTKQLLTNYADIPHDMIQAVITSNRSRKDHIAHAIMQHNPQTIGIYRLSMKKNSDNFRSSSMLGIIERLHEHDADLILYEPSITSPSFLGCNVTSDLDHFKSTSDIIVTNRMYDELDDVLDKVYSRDLYSRD